MSTCLPAHACHHPRSSVLSFLWGEVLETVLPKLVTRNQCGTQKAGLWVKNCIINYFSSVGYFRDFFLWQESFPIVPVYVWLWTRECRNAVINCTEPGPLWCRSRWGFVTASSFTSVVSCCGLIFEADRLTWAESSSRLAVLQTRRPEISAKQPWRLT